VAETEPRYHHGDLRAALLAAAEAELAEKGFSGFTLRGTAKRAGVSHAAPAHHFRDASALLTALAARGFARLEAAMREAQAEAAAEPRAQVVAAGRGYFRFGMTNPALLQLMFGPDRLEQDDPALKACGGAAFALLVDNVSRYLGHPALDSDEGRRLISLAWSIVHGFTRLASTGQLHYLAPADAAVIEDHLAAILADALPRRPCADAATPPSRGQLPAPD
jgi:AcrR family transcriptional regulator